jgi:hypothetical protein
VFAVFYVSLGMVYASLKIDGLRDGSTLVGGIGEHAYHHESVRGAMIRLLPCLSENFGFESLLCCHSRLQICLSWARCDRGEASQLHHNDRKHPLKYIVTL